MGEIEIRGGAGPYEVAAVAAVVELVLREETVARARRPAPNVPPAWVRRVHPAHRGVPVAPDPGRTSPL